MSAPDSAIIISSDDSDETKTDNNQVYLLYPYPTVIYSNNLQNEVTVTNTVVVTKESATNSETFSRSVLRPTTPKYAKSSDPTITYTNSMPFNNILSWTSPSVSPLTGAQVISFPNISPRFPFAHFIPVPYQCQPFSKGAVNFNGITSRTQVNNKQGGGVLAPSLDSIIASHTESTSVPSIIHTEAPPIEQSAITLSCVPYNRESNRAQPPSPYNVYITEPSTAVPSAENTNLPQEMSELISSYNHAKSHTSKPVEKILSPQSLLQNALEKPIEKTVIPEPNTCVEYDLETSQEQIASPFPISQSQDKTCMKKNEAEISKKGKFKFVCNLCSYSGTTKAHIKIHGKYSHPGSDIKAMQRNSFDAEIKPPDNTNILDSIKPYLCLAKYCYFRALSIPDLLQHIENHSSLQQYQCPECTYCSQEIQEIVWHYHDHGGFHIFHCTYCHYGTDSKQNILFHSCNEHPDRAVKFFVRESPARPSVNSMKRQLSGEPFNATTNETSLVSKKTLETNQSTHYPVLSALLASRNSHAFSDRESKRRKIEDESSIRSKSTEECNNNLESLPIPQNTENTLEQKYSCSRCSFETCEIKSYLKHIVLTHSYMFRCKFCSETYKKEKDLEHHILVDHMKNHSQSTAVEEEEKLSNVEEEKLSNEEEEKLSNEEHEILDAVGEKLVVEESGMVDVEDDKNSSLDNEQKETPKETITVNVGANSIPLGVFINIFDIQPLIVLTDIKYNILNDLPL